MTDALDTSRVERDRTNRRQQIPQRNDPRRPFAGDVGERHRPRQRECAGCRPAQRVEMRTAPERDPEIVRQRPDVEAGTTRDLERQAIVGQLDEVERARGDVDGRQRDGVEPSGVHVSPRPVDVLGRVERWRLRERATERLQHRLHLDRGDLRRGPPRPTSGSAIGTQGLGDGAAAPDVGCGRLTEGIVGGRGHAEPNHGAVGLRGGAEELGEARRPAEDERQDAGSDRVERSGVTDLAQVPQASDHGHDIVRGRALRFVDDQHAVETAGLRGDHGQRASGQRRRDVTPAR